MTNPETTPPRQTYVVSSDKPRPYFAEIPYYVWGDINYDSDGNCEFPTDQEWTELYLANRETGESLTIQCLEDTWEIEGDGPAAARTALFLSQRCAATPIDNELCMETLCGDWQHEVAWRRALTVQNTFSNPVLKPFDIHYFFGSWKWIGWFASEFTWVGRWIMLSVERDDPRAVALCMDWLAEGAWDEQTAALSHALTKLTGLKKETPEEWLAWYRDEGCKTFPAPDLDAWYADLKATVER